MIAPGTVFRGELTSSDPVEIRGTLEGDSRVDAHYLVGEGGRVLGNIDAASLVIAGEVMAGLLTADKIELRATARVAGTLRARVVVIADGAQYDGEVEVQRAGAPSRAAPIKDRRRGPNEEPAKG